MGKPKAGKLPFGPPVILALETSGLCGSVALVSENFCIGEYSLQSKLTHSTRLLTGIDWLLNEAAMSWEQLDGIAVSLGPGSFTGLRIGLSTAKGLAMAAGLELLGVPTLDGLASQLHFAPHLICPVLDARKKQVYTALYRPQHGGTVEQISDYLVVAPEELVRRISEPTIFIGEGLTVYGDFLKERLGELAHLAPGETYFARASAIGMLAIAKWRKQEFLPLADAEPIYVRASDAELQFGKARSA